MSSSQSNLDGVLSRVRTPSLKRHKSTRIRTPGRAKPTAACGRLHLGRQRLVQYCKQILKIDQHIEKIRSSHDHSKHERRKSCYEMHMGLSVMENQRNEYAESLNQKADELIEIQKSMNSINELAQSYNYRR